VDDLIEINLYTLEVWGERQADLYELDLRACCSRIAAAPYTGRACGEYGAGLRRIEQSSHVVFYRIKSDGILIARILHSGMQPTKGRFLV
jgi:toxin ParE1/3/4